MTNVGGGHGMQGRSAADGSDSGPAFSPERGPTSRLDLVVALAAITLVVGVVLVVAL